MVKKHLFRLNAPKTWHIERKKTSFIMRPMPGPHALELCMPLSMVLREVLNLCKTNREAKMILNEGKAHVNGVVRKEEKFPVGFMDVLSIPALGKLYRCLLNKKGNLSFKEIDEKEAGIKPLKVIGKKTSKGGKTQINLSDGTNMFVDKGSLKRNDTIVFDLKSKKVAEHLPFQKGALLYIVDGSNVGEVGSLEEVKSYGKGLPDNIVVKTEHGSFETRKDYSMVIGKEKGVISI